MVSKISLTSVTTQITRVVVKKRVPGMDFSLNYSAWKVCFNLIDFINRITYSFYVCNEDFIVRVVDIIYQGLNKTLFPRFFSADLLKLFQGILTEYMVISSIWKYKTSFFKKNLVIKSWNFEIKLVSLEYQMLIFFFEVTNGKFWS